MTKLKDVQMEVGEWSEENFGAEQPSHYPLMGAGEELGELIHSILKRKQGIRQDEEDVGVEAERDAVGDIGVYLMDFLYREGYVIDTTEPIRANTEDMVEEMSEAEVIGTLYGSYGQLWQQYPDFIENFVLQRVVMVFIALDVLCQLRDDLGGFEECLELAWYGEVKDRNWNSDVEV